MEKLTITEALAETKTIVARIEKQRQSVMRYLARDARLRDPLEKDGSTSVEFVKRTRQSIADLEDRLVRIRCAIQKTNGETSLTVLDETHTVAYWLNWRREVAEHRGGFLAAIPQGLASIRQPQASRMARNTAEAAPTPVDIVVAVDEREIAEEIDRHTTTVGVLDGKLSLVNATTLIEF